MARQVKTVTNLGQVIEYIPDRLYLASYISPPDENTLFPYPPESAPQPRTPGKRSRAAAEAAKPAPKSAPQKPFYFTVDEALLYNAFHHDFGPLHIGHLYRFALHFHDILGAKENKDRPVVFWSRADPRSRANAACMLACYMVLIQSWPPHLALAPIAQVDPPLMPFRDAGYSQADYGISVQDVVYGVWKAKEEGCCALENFELDEYERYERVEHGDFNWITPNFVAFASPQHAPIERITESSEHFATLPRTLAAVEAHKTLPQPFKNVLQHFSEKKVGLVVRLNSELYSPSYFEGVGIHHLDMIFEDGTCPQLSTVRKFVRLAHEMITVRKKNIAVHCKAGLGRTGCLIGAYLIYRHGFTANEIIAFMRFMRPGMVVGPQQHWLHLNQGTFREWWVEERIERRLRREMAAKAAVPSTPIRAMQKANLGQSSQGGASTPPNRSVSNRTPLSEVNNERTTTTTTTQDDYLPAPTPGQPRKSVRADRHHPYARSSGGYAADADAQLHHEVEVEVLAVQQQRGSLHGGATSDEELLLRMRAAHKKVARTSPAGGKSRAVSHSVTTTTTTTRFQQATATTEFIDPDASRDVENLGASLGRKEARAASGAILAAKVRAAAAGAKGRPAAAAAGVRKTSGRVGSVGNSAAAVAHARKVSGV